MTEASEPVKKIRGFSKKKKDYTKFDGFIKSIASDIKDPAYPAEHKLKENAVNSLNETVYFILGRFKSEIIKIMSFAKRRNITIDDEIIKYAFNNIFTPNSRSDIWDYNAIVTLEVLKKDIDDAIADSLELYKKHRDNKQKDKKEGTVDEKKKGKQTISNICDLKMPVRRIQSWLRSNFPGKRITMKGSITLATIIEYCIEEFIIMSRGNIPNHRTSKSIGTTDIYNTLETVTVWKYMLSQFMI